MAVKLPPAPAQYSRADQQEVRAQLDALFRKAYQMGMNVEIPLGVSFIMASPNGNRWAVSVSNAGAMVVTGL